MAPGSSLTGQAARAKEEHTTAGRAPPAASARSPGQGRWTWLGCSDSGPEEAGSLQGWDTRSSLGSATDGWIAVGKRLTLGPLSDKRGQYLPCQHPGVILRTKDTAHGQARVP